MPHKMKNSVRGEDDLRVHVIGKKNHLAKPARVRNDDSGMAALFTATRQRPDIFTSDKQDIVTDIEPLMQSIKKKNKKERSKLKTRKGGLDQLGVV